jgi:hypothetical protein
LKPRAIRTGAAAQRGLSLIGLILLSAIIIAIAVLAVRLAPSALEFVAIRKAVERIAASPESTPRDMRSSFDRIASVEDIQSISGKDLIIERVDNQTMVAFAYEKRVLLFGPVSLLIEYNGKSRR